MAPPARLAVMALLASLWGAAPGAQTADAEYRLKAAFVYQFLQFVEWPAGALPERGELAICVLQPHPFGTVLEQIVSGEAIAGHPVRLRAVTGRSDLESCHALVAAGQAGREAAATLKLVATRPVLTIGEGDAFLDAGGIIALHVVERRIRFEISLAHARRADLRLSAQLLRLAAAVRGGAP